MDRLKELPMNHFLVTGHRGAAGLEPENTVRSFRRACDLGVDRVETDVQLTRDGRLVCIHDATVDRTTNGTGAVAALTFEEIRRLDAGQGEQVPTLEEAIAAVHGRTVLQIELKGEGTVSPTLAVLEALGMRSDETLLTCFDTRRLEEARDRRPDLPVSLLFGQPPADAVERAQSVGASSLSIQHTHLTRDWVDAAHAAGLEICGWNPDTRGEMERVLDLGVDGLGSNRPDILIELLRERGLR
jgi:glycerophosphoryl diester phosphodiesterase